MTGYDLQLHLRYKNCIWNKEKLDKILFKHENVFKLPVCFIGSYTEDEPDFPQQKNLILHKTGV